MWTLQTLCVYGVHLLTIDFLLILAKNSKVFELKPRIKDKFQDKSAADKLFKKKKASKKINALMEYENYYVQVSSLSLILYDKIQSFLLK